MSLKDGNSLYWKAGIDTSKLAVDTMAAKTMVTGLARAVATINPFAAIGVGAALAFAKASKSSYEFVKEFKAAMTEVATISDDVANNFEEMSNKIIELSRNTPEEAAKLAKGYYQVISAGFTNTAEALEILKASDELAVGGLTDTYTAVDAVTTIMNAYAGEVKDAYEVTDNLFTTVRLGKTRMEELAPDITMIAGLAANAGLSFQDLMTAISEGTKTMRTDQFITGMRGFLTALVKPSDEAKIIAKELGLEFNTMALRTKGLNGFLQELIEKTQMSDSVLATLFPEVRGLNGVLAIARENGAAFNKTLQEQTKSTKELGETTQKAFEIMNTKTVNQQKIFWNNMLANMKPVGDYLNNVINAGFTKLNELIGNAHGTIEQNEFKKRAETAIAARRVFTSNSNAYLMSEARTRPDYENYFNQTIGKQLNRNAVGGFSGINYGKDWSFTADQLRELLDLNEKRLAVQNDIIARTDIETQMVELTVKARMKDTEQVKKTVAPQSKGTGLSADELLAQAKAREDAEKAAKDAAEKEKERREKLYAELLKATMTDEEKIAAIKKHYADLRSVADTDARKKAIDTLEAKDLEYLKFQKDLGQEELQYKMSWSEEELNARIADLNTLMAQYEGNAQAEYEAYQELQTRKAQLDDIYKERRENTLKSLFKSTKYMTEQEIKDYKKILELELTKINDNETVLSISQEIARTEEEIQNRQIEKLQDVSKIFTGIASTVREYNSDLADALQIISDMSDTLISMKEAISAESFLTSVTSLLSVGTTLGNLIYKGLTSGQHSRNSDLYKKDTSDFGYFQKTIEFQKDFYERLTNELDRASGTDKLAQYKTNMSVLLSNIKNSQNSLKQLEGEQLDNMKDYITDLQDELATLQEEYKQAITGTTVESIADSISEGFQEGLSSAEMFADSFENMMKTAILTAFKNQIVTDYISSFYDTFASFSENGLSEAEIDALSGTFRRMMTESADLWAQMEEIASNAGIDLSSTSTDTGLSGAISGITEETAGLLAGQFNAVRINTIQIKASVDNLLSPVMDISNLNRSMLSALNNIDDNTAKTAKYTQVLNSIDSRLAAMQNAGAYIRAIG